MEKRRGKRERRGNFKQGRGKRERERWGKGGMNKCSNKWTRRDLRRKEIKREGNLSTPHSKLGRRPGKKRSEWKYPFRPKPKKTLFRH